MAPTVWGLCFAWELGPHIPPHAFTCDLVINTDMSLENRSVSGNPINDINLSLWKVEASLCVRCLFWSLVSRKRKTERIALCEHPPCGLWTR